MKKLMLIFLFLPIIAASCSSDDDGPEGPIITGNVSVKADQTIYSPENNCYFKYNVILPSSFNVDPSTKYPVLYLLHGADGSNTDWCNGGNAASVVQEYIKSGKLPEIVVVMPDAKNTSYVDGYQDGIKYETFFHQTLMPYIESTYRIIGERDNRFIAGLSMGGFGASYYAFTYPEKFRYCYCMSGAVGGMGSALTPDIPTLVADKDFSSLPDYTMDIGTEDFLYATNVGVHNALEQMGFDHEFIQRSGAHDWKFWQEALPKALDRIGSYLKQ